MTVSELENRMSAAELTEWMVYFAMEPFGNQQADYRAGMICTLIAKTMGGMKNAAPDKFFPIYKNRDAAPKQSPESQMAIFQGLASGEIRLLDDETVGETV